MYNFIKIYGLMRTGTNYISSLLKLNFKNTFVFMNVGGWKHGYFIKYPNNKNVLNSVDKKARRIYHKQKLIKLFRLNKVKFIIMIKNPYKWLLSVLKHKGKEINENNIKLELKDWNLKYKNYKYHLENGTALLIRYEDLLENRNLILNKIKNKYKLNKKSVNYKNINKILNANFDCNLGKTKNKIFNKKEFYLDNSNKLFSDEILQVINENINKNLLNYYGYKLLK
jgi:hypothetical protein